MAWYWPSSGTPAERQRWTKKQKTIPLSYSILSYLTNIKTNKQKCQEIVYVKRKKVSKSSFKFNLAIHIFLHKVTFLSHQWWRCVWSSWLNIAFSAPLKVVTGSSHWVCPQSEYCWAVVVTSPLLDSIALLWFHLGPPWPRTLDPPTNSHMNRVTLNKKWYRRMFISIYLY